MNAVLVILAIASFVAAGVFGWLAWRLLREERQRSAARVAALSAAIDAGLPSPRATAPVAVASLFSPEHSEAARGVPVIKVAVGIAMAMIVIVALAMANRGGSTEQSSEPAAVATASNRSAAPLELVSMRHEREGAELTVLGLVRNPRNGRTMARVTAIVFAFNRAGEFVASGRAQLDFTTLEAGDESPFVVKVPAVSDIGRYRVSFRTEAGVVRHVDRRGDQMRLASSGITR
jgi:predicted permease